MILYLHWNMRQESIGYNIWSVLCVDTTEVGSSSLIDSLYGGSNWKPILTTDPESSIHS